MHSVEIVLVVVLLGALTGISARYLRGIPLPLIQIALGALLSWPQKGLHIAFDPELFMLLFIPPLLFADGWRIPKREFFAQRVPILRLALGLVLFTVLGLGYAIHWLIPEIPLTVAFALAAVVSPTDAVAVSAITRGLRMPADTMHLLEGESLLNDASGLVALKFAVAATVTGLFSWTGVAREFLWVALGGVGIGVALGWGFARGRAIVTRRVGDVAATQMVLLLMLLPFAAYIVGERLGVSGILAAVAAGVTTNFADLNRSEFVAERIQTEGTWTMIESAFNGAIFLLLGLQLPSIFGRIHEHTSHSTWVMAGYVSAVSIGLLLMRWIWLSLAIKGSLLRAHLQGRIAEPPSWRVTLATTLAGIRGAITLAGALSVPLMIDANTPFPARDLMIFLATGTILFTLVVGSVGLPLVLRGLPPPTEAPQAREERLARLAACRAAMASLTHTPDEWAQAHPGEAAVYEETAGQLTRNYRHHIDLLDDEIVRAAPSTPQAKAEAIETTEARKHRYVVELMLRLNCLRAERDALYAERQAHRINDASLRSLVEEVDLSEISLRKRLAAAQAAVRAAAGAQKSG